MKIIHLIFICITALYFSCADYILPLEDCSCFDPECGCYIPPQLSIENLEVNGNDVTINWNSPESVTLTTFSYRYNYENSFYENFVDWVDIGENIQQFTLLGLFDGDYHIEILGRFYSEHEDSTAIAAIDFNLDYLQNYSLSLFPFSQIAVVNDTIDLFVSIPRIDNVIGYQIDILYNPEILEISEENIVKGNLIESFPGAIFLPEIIDNLIRIHILTVEGNSPISEDGSVAKLSFLAKLPADTEIILSNSSTLRNINNVEIPIDTLYNCSVSILE